MFSGWQLSKHISPDPVRKLREPSTISSTGQAGKGRSLAVSYSETLRNRYTKTMRTGSLMPAGG